MARGLEGKRVVIAGSRKLQELSEIIERQGGEAFVRPQQGLLMLKEREVEQELLQLADRGTDWAIFTTGTGFSALMEQAEKIGVRDRLLDILRHAKVGARGYKTFSLLKQQGIQTLVVDEDGTTQGLIRALQGQQFAGQDVAIQLHGEPMPELVAFFERQGADVQAILPYRHVAPDPDVSHQLSQEIVEGAVDAVCFTTAVQVRYFFEFVKSNNLYSDIKESFRNGVIAVAVGRITAEALKEEGIERVVAPEKERMGAMIIELARYYQNTTTQRVIMD
ncbi:uroporphyrinogen-III synthase [Paenibacillus radicis (ex Gao et al. 2016)]|uniref:uroporphyrinogen-III synthase n=1 Tax=Paenibacillus radicis (ex Gao et al. 2016) TaxID=1737354 RepID=UPI001662CA02|nr:uroporphyrinogen-III synthase [Paenibacillus radicis (ex Gao et al. 2016)]